MIIFDGDQRAAQLEQQLQQQVQALVRQGTVLKIAAILFEEDAGSQLYTRLKSEAAVRAGIEYEVYEFSMSANVEQVAQKIVELNQDSTVTGIIIQKPWRNTWVKVKGINQDKGIKAVRQAFNAWWEFLTSKIELSKDVDGLHPDQKKILPATAKAVMTILDEAYLELKISTTDQLQQQIFVLGRSDIVGQPVFAELVKKGFKVKMLTRDDVKQRLNSPKMFLDADVIISATGVEHLVTGGMVKKGVIVIDVGEPRPDADLESMNSKAAFITPVPGGVGPMTVMSLLANCVKLAS